MSLRTSHFLMTYLASSLSLSKLSHFSPNFPNEDICQRDEGNYLKFCKRKYDSDVQEAYSILILTSLQQIRLRIHLTLKL